MLGGRRTYLFREGAASGRIVGVKELLDVACVIQVLAAWHGDVSKLSAAVPPGEALVSDAILADHSSRREVSIVCRRGGGGLG